MILKNNKFYLLLLLILLLSLHFGGKLVISNSFLNPFLIFLGYCLFAIFALQNTIKSAPSKFAIKNIILFFLLGFSVIALGYEEFRKVVISISVFDPYSDILTQLIAQCNWLLNGEFPYQEVSSPFFGHRPFPVYMPLQWMPLIIPIKANFDVRWIGFWALALAFGAWGIFYFRRVVFSLKSILLFFIPTLVFLGFSLKIFGPIYGVTIETLIAAYYMVLMMGLLSKKTWLIALGISLCLLSRYTLLFWLPLFAYVFFKENTIKKNIQLWGAVAIAVLLVYIIPFFSQDTTIFSKGIIYHNLCAMSEISGFGPYHISGTFTEKIHFAEFFKSVINNTDDVYTTKIIRIIQLLVMLLLNIVGVLVYEKNKAKNTFDVYNFLAVFLILFIAFFYLFSPLTYFYYLMVPLYLLSNYVSFSCSEGRGIVSN